MSDLATLRQQLAAATTVEQMESIAREILKGQGERHKTEAERVRRENEELAGKREALTSDIWTAVKAMGLDKQLVALKAKGFTFTIDHREDSRGRIDKDGEVTVTGGCALMLGTIAKSKATGVGSTGKTKDEFGLSLSEVFEKYATDDDRTKLAEAETKDEEVRAKTGKTNQGYQHNVKTSVKKQAIAAGLLAPVK